MKRRLTRFLKNSQGFPALLSFLGGLLLVFFVVGCSETPSGTRKVLRLTLGAEPPTLDGSLATDSASIRIITNLMEGLTQFDENLKPLSAIADHWNYSSDYKTITYHLRGDVFWTDGKPVTAHDFEFSWKRLLSPATAAQYAYFLFDIENAYEYNVGKIMNPDRIGVKALSPRVLEVQLKRPVVYFPSITTFMVTFPQRQDLIETYGNHWTDPENLITNGPFTLAEWNHEYKLVLKANPNFYEGKPLLSRVDFYIVEEANTALTLYETCELDITDLPPIAFSSYQDHPEFIQRNQLTGNYYAFNVNKPPFDDPRVRQAFSHAIDRSRIPDILRGEQVPSTSWIPKGMFGFNPMIGARFNFEKARQLLSEVGYPNGIGFPKVTAVYNTNQNNRLIAEFLQAQWKEHLNVVVELDALEWKVFLNRLKIDPPQLYRGSWVADFPDPENFMNLFTSPSGNNRSNWNQTKYDQLVAFGAAEQDTRKRQSLYDKAQQILTETEVPIIPLFVSTANRLVKPYVKGYRLDAMNTLHLKRIDVQRD